MNKKLGRLLKPSFGLYLLVMIGFSAAAVVMRYYHLAIAEIAVTMLVAAIHVIYKNHRRKNLQNFIKKTQEELGDAKDVENPFPIAVVRLADNGVVYTNEQYIRLTGFADTMTEKQIDQILPGFATDWLASGKTEYP